MTAAAGFDDPPLQVPVTPEPSPTVYDWSGPYVGLMVAGSMGTFAGIDGDFGDPIFPGDGEGDLEGTTYGLYAGYNVQRGTLVYGAELGYQGKGISGSEACANPVFQCGVDIDSVLTLSGRLGFLASPRTLLYGSLGYAQAQTNGYVDDGLRQGEDKTIDGYVVGLGVEYMATDTVLLRGGVQVFDFAETDYQTDLPYDDVNSDFTQIFVGVTYRF